MLDPTMLGEVAFDNMVKVLSDHYCLKPSEIVYYITEAETLENQSARLSRKLEL